MHRIRFNGELYALPFVKLFRAHTPAELDGLRADIAAKGIWAPVITGTTDQDGRIVIDGATRATIALELGQDIPTIDVGHLSVADAEGRAKALNIHRRHLTTIELSKLTSLIAQGKNQREAAAALGVNQSSVSRALEKLKQASDAVHQDDDSGQQSQAHSIAPRRTTAPTPKTIRSPRSPMPETLAQDHACDALREVAKLLTAAGNKLAEVLTDSPVEEELRKLLKVKKGESRWAFLDEVRDRLKELAG